MESLQAMFPEIPKDTLVIILREFNGDGNAAALALLGESSKPRKRHHLDDFYSKKDSKRNAGDKNRPKKADPNLPSAFERLHDSKVDDVPTVSALPLVVTSHNVYTETDGMCCIIHNVLPPELANKLYLCMLDESEGAGKSTSEPWTPNEFYIVDKLVRSTHSTAFYRRSSFKSNTKDDSFWYFGRKQKDTPRFFTPGMEEACVYVKDTVNNILQKQGRHELEWQDDWQPNVAAANRYSGRDSYVGWHADILNRIGPRTTIASLSLGTTRDFRLRKVPRARDGPTRTLVMSLPHNSLVIMLPGCQEFYRHTVPTMKAVDAFHLNGKDYADRINITYRFYRPDFDPSPRGAYQGTPRCFCDKECDLRPDLNGKVSRREDVDDELPYFWMCGAGKQNNGQSCGFFQFLDMKREGRGPWYNEG